MGGFHGGHSGGSGGFHGGSHHSSHSSHSHSSHSSHSSGSRIHVGPGFIISSSGNRIKKSRVSQIIAFFAIAVFLIMFGTTVFLPLFDVPTKATITKAQITGSGYSQYEVYDFEYEFNHRTYFGYGDDDLTADGELSIKVGEEYKLYVSPFFPSDYRFESKAVKGVAFLILFYGLGTFFIVQGIIKYRYFKKQLALVGDANKDGIVNEADLDYVESQAHAKTEGAYEGTKAAEAENAYLKNKIYRRCPYCDSIVDDNAKFCSNCGSNLNDK